MIIKKPLIALAPLAGTSDPTMRKLCMECGADMCTTEMISAKAIFYKDKKTLELAKISDDERPCSIQLFGSEPDIMAYGAEKMLEYKPFAIDINMGCPVGKIVSNHEGSALMKDEILAGKIVEAVKKVCGNTPVTVKFRSGFDREHINAVSFARHLEACGADMICVHGRTREQMYSGKADRGIIKQVKDSVHIPVLANGDIFSPEDAASMLKETGADGIMVARGALGDPFIFKRIKEYLNSGSYAVENTNERLDMAIRHTKMLVSDKGEYIGVREARKHLGWYIKGLPGSASARGRINAAETLEEMEKIIALLYE